MEFLMTQNVAGALLSINNAFLSTQPKLPRRSGTNNAGKPGLSVVGLGTDYPQHQLETSVLDTLARRHYPETPAMRDFLSITRDAGNQRRSSIIDHDHALLNQDDAPSIAQIHQVFIQEGVPLAVRAAKKALQEAHVNRNRLTHIIFNTNTDSRSLGIDRLLKLGLGVTASVEFILLHGEGALGVLRTAANVTSPCTTAGKPARILCIVLDINTTMLRSELDRVHELQEAKSDACLLSDCGSAMLLSNGIGEACAPVYDILRWQQSTMSATEQEIGSDSHQPAPKSHLSERLSTLFNGALVPGYIDLIGLPQSEGERPHPAKFDWAVEPFSGPVLSGAEEVLSITAENLRASYGIYGNHGHSGSAALFGVLDLLRSKDMDAVTFAGVGRDYVIACSFGPGIVLDMCMLRRLKYERDRGGAPQLQSRTPSDTSTTTTMGGSEK